MTPAESPSITKTSEPGSGANHSPSTTVRLRVRGFDGSQRTLEFPGASPAEAIRRAAGRGFQVLAIESERLVVSRTSGRGARFPLLLFSQELLALLDAGLNLTEALATLVAKERQPAIHVILQQILQSLSEGKNFSDVLSALPNFFPDVYVATIRASERTGSLPQALSRFIAYQLQFDGIRKKLTSAAIYPMMLLFMGGFVTLFLLGYVVPRFSSVYESSGREVPWMSAVLLSFGNVIYEYWKIVLAGVVTTIGLASWGLSRPEGRLYVINRFLKLPWLAAKADEFRLSRFYRAVGLLLAAGIALPRAMGMVTGLLSPSQQERLTMARLSVEQGQTLSSALIAANLASPVAESLIKVGERSGQLAEMLERTARFHDEDFSRWVDWASRLLEPIMMAAIGLVIGTVVVLMYIPIFELAGSLQ